MAYQTSRQTLINTYVVSAIFYKQAGDGFGSRLMMAGATLAACRPHSETRGGTRL